MASFEEVPNTVKYNTSSSANASAANSPLPLSTPTELPGSDINSSLTAIENIGILDKSIIAPNLLPLVQIEDNNNSIVNSLMNSLSGICAEPIIEIDNPFQSSNVSNKIHSLDSSPTLIGNMFSEVFEGQPSALEGGSLEDNCTSLMDNGVERNCKLCNNRLTSPRVLSCLHVFCESCLNKLLTDEVSISSAASTSSASSMSGDRVISPPLKTAIKCPTCRQITMVGSKGVESLLPDFLLTNILDLSTIESEQLCCTSCKSKEIAISRCSECANFLCGGCDNAHKYMRCFENHEVVKLEDLQQKAASEKTFIIHKPLFCHVHTAENLKYYCFSCQMPVCNDCLIADHKGSEHQYDIISAAEKEVRNEVEKLMKEAKSKVQYCDSAASNLSCALNELQSQHDSARHLIEDTHKNYLQILEKCKESSLNELNKLHSERELKIMDVLQNIENMMGKIKSTCSFTTRVLEQANAAEFLTMKKLINAQFSKLIHNTPKCEINYSLNFVTKPEKFEQVAQELFGKFRTESSPPSPKESTPPPTLPGMPPSMIGARSVLNNYVNGNQQSNNNNNNNHHNNSNNNNNGIVSVNQTNGSVTASSPISLPHSMQSSFDSDLIGNNNVNGVNGVGGGSVNGNFMMNNVLNHADTTSVPQNMMQQSCMQPPPSKPHNNLGYNNTINNIMNNSGVMGNGAGLNLNGLNGLTGSLTASTLATNGQVNSGAATPAPGHYNSMLEYNLSRLASLSESTTDVLTDGLTGTGTTNGVGAHNAVNNQPITLNDILNGDQRALNNLHALAKIGLNTNDVDFNTDMSSTALLSAGVSPSGLDCFLPDFCLPQSAPSPSLSSLQNGLGPVDDMSLTNFHANAPTNSTNIATGRNKATPMQIRCKFGSLGTSKGQFNSPHGFCLGVDEEIIVADTNNHRIEVFDKSGTLKFQFGVPGKEEGQLWYPRKVAVMHTNGKFVVCDRGNERSRMQIFSKCGHFMRKIAIRYIDIVAGLAVTSKGHIVAVDSVSPTVFVISEDGELVRWFDCSDYMREPSDIAIRDNDFYVCDFKGHCVAVFQEDGTFQYRIGNEKVTCFPNGIDISNAGDILIGDSHGNRFHVAVYSRDGKLQSEFECPHVKVSRCCGLKITSEGYVVTLAKNNHHVLVLNTLYVH